MATSLCPVYKSNLCQMAFCQRKSLPALEIFLYLHNNNPSMYTSLSTVKEAYFLLLELAHLAVIHFSADAHCRKCVSWGRKITWGSIDEKESSEHDGIGFMEISKTLVIQAFYRANIDLIWVNWKTNNTDRLLLPMTILHKNNKKWWHTGLSRSDNK